MRIDFHAHVLPGADHGSDSLQTSRRQLELAAAAGVDTVVATPHFYPSHDTLEAFLARRAAAVTRLAEAPLSGPALALGAEVHLCAGLEHMEGLEQLCICGTTVILLELPYRNWSHAVFETVLKLQEDPRYTPVLAHVDRYAPEIIEELFDIGVAGQLNAEGLCRLMGRRRLLGWAAQGRIAALGSDIHGTKTGYKPFQKALRRLGENGARIMAASEALLSSARLLDFSSNNQ